jgi:hypothetical protein
MTKGTKLEFAAKPKAPVARVVVLIEYLLAIAAALTFVEFVIIG